MLERPEHPRNAYAWMDAFRTVAAVLVAVSHVRDIIWRDAVPTNGLVTKVFYLLTGFGHIGVVVFFTLSGFWITRSVMKRIDQPRFWPNYLIDRVSRLWIVLIPVLIIGGTLDWAGAFYWAFPNYMADTGLHSISVPVANTLSVSEFFGSLFFLGTIVVPPLGSNGPLWSLAFEFWYYIWFPALVLLIRSRKLSFALVTLGLALILPNLAFGFLSWLTGSALSFAVDRARPIPNFRWEKLVFAFSFLMLMAMLLVARVAQSIWFDPVLAASFALFLFCLCRNDFAFPRLLRPLADFGSKSSFSLYALHFPLAMMLAGLLTGGIRQPPSLTLLGSTVLILAILIVTAFVFSLLTEYRTDVVRGTLKRWFLGGPRPTAALPGTSQPSHENSQPWT
ncbi:acyltransferase [Sphingomonas sp. HH69]